MQIRQEFFIYIRLIHVKNGEIKVSQTFFDLSFRNICVIRILSFEVWIYPIDKLFCVVKVAVIEFAGVRYTL